MDALRDTGACAATTSDTQLRYPVAKCHQQGRASCRNQRRTITAPVALRDRGRISAITVRWRKTPPQPQQQTVSQHNAPSEVVPLHNATAVVIWYHAMHARKKLAFLAYVGRDVEKVGHGLPTTVPSFRLPPVECASRPTMSRIDRWQKSTNIFFR